MAKRLSEDARAELEGRRERLALKLRLVEAAKLLSDEVLRLQERARPEEAVRLRGRWRDWVG